MSRTQRSQTVDKRAWQPVDWCWPPSTADSMTHLHRLSINTLSREKVGETVVHSPYLPTGDLRVSQRQRKNLFILVSHLWFWPGAWMRDKDCLSQVLTVSIIGYGSKNGSGKKYITCDGMWCGRNNDVKHHRLSRIWLLAFLFTTYVLFKHAPPPFFFFEWTAS